MWGLVGNLVVLLLNGISAFRFADGDYNVDAMVLAGEAVRPFPCPAGSEEKARPPERQPLSASDLRAELSGNTLHSDRVPMFPMLGGDLNIFSATDGVVYGTSKAELDGGTEHDAGRWHIPQEGQF
jgi:hypothetical protein